MTQQIGDRDDSIELLQHENQKLKEQVNLLNEEVDSLTKEVSRLATCHAQLFHSQSEFFDARTDSLKAFVSELREVNDQVREMAIAKSASIYRQLADVLIEKVELKHRLADYLDLVREGSKLIGSKATKSDMREFIIKFNLVSQLQLRGYLESKKDISFNVKSELES